MTYYNYGNLFRPLREIKWGFILLIMLVMGVGNAWAQGSDPTPTVDVWDGTVPSTTNVSVAECNKIGITGNGTEADPYVISTAGQFAYFASKMNSNTAWWKLKAGIELDLNGSVHPWTYGQNGANFKGHFDGNGSTISNMKFEANATGKNWGLFPQLQGGGATNHAEVKNLIIKNSEIATPTTGSYASAAIGILCGKANGNVDIENVTVTGGTITVDVETTGAHNVAGLVGQLATNENNVKNCTVSDVTITSGTAAKKEYYVGGITGNADKYAVIVGNTVKNFKVTLGGNTSGNNIIGGLIGKVTGANTTVSATRPMGLRALIQHNTVTNDTIIMNGSVEVAYFEVGGLIGWIGIHTNAFNNKVTSPTIVLNNDINNTSYVGGAIGYQDKQSFVDGIVVSGGSITGPTALDPITNEVIGVDKTVKNATLFFVGGFLGYQNSSAATNFDANKFKNVAVTGMDINLGNYVPAGQIKDHKFSVGGIAGSVNAPNMRADGTWGGMPENLIFKGGKIYAPWASTSPIVANFNAAAATHQNMTPDVVTTVDAIEKAKANTWYYNDYKLGLSSEFLSSESVTEYNATPAKDKFRKNYSKATEKIGDIQYLAIDNSTFLRSNRYQDSERDLKTVLWWTQQASMDKSKGTVAAVTCFTANEQPIYPQSGATAAQAGNLASFPHYMYFFQGVGNAKYASDTDAANIVKGIEANFTNDVMPAVAMADETNLNVTITNEGETRRGFDNRTLTVTVQQNKADVTSSYTYQWYLDGKADGTGTTKTLTPHWKDGQGITVNVLSGTKIVATASYGFAPGMLHTKKSITEPTDPEAKKEEIRSDYNNRGTSTNPYVIDCESALRQLSYLSTVHTSMYWETLGKPGTGYVANQPQGHYNRAYYELSADIDMGGREFTPISHVGYGSDGSNGTYSTNWIFQGVFDGKGHAIKNFKITWGASQYVGNNVNCYYGLFGCVGNAAAARKWGDAGNGNTVIKNLVIDGATLTHNTAETSFYYDQSISTNANYCMVGVLAGIVSSNTTVQNIEIRNSSITDAGSQDYSLAGKGLYVGGAIGAEQAAYSATANAPASTTIQHIAAQVDISLTHPTILKMSDATQTGSFNVGGILGRYVATSATKAQVDPTAPAYTIYSGKIDAPRAWISPVVASMRYSAQQGFNFNNHSKHWEGNNNSDATQITITNALYYDFYIGSTKITDKVPSNTCGRGNRTMTAHADGTDAAGTYAAQKYQGVNYGAQCLINYGDALSLLNANTEDYHWFWNGTNNFVRMSTDRFVDAILSRDGNAFTASLSEGTPTSYRWMISFDKITWYEVSDATTNQYTAPASPKTKNVKAFVGDGSNEYPTTSMEVEAATDLCNPTLSSADATGGRTYTVNLNEKTSGAISHLDVEYQWTGWDKNVIPGEIGNTHNITAADIAAVHDLVWCTITLKEFGEVMAEYTLLGGGTVVFVDGAKGVDNVGDSRVRGFDAEHPVKTIDHANSLLRAEGNGGTIDNNIIVVMGLLNAKETINSKSKYRFQSNGKNPATLTGKWNGVDYQGKIGLSQIDSYDEVAKKYDEHLLNRVNEPGQTGANCYVLADTKFEYLTFEGNDEGNTFIELHGNDAFFGKGLVMTDFNTLSPAHGNLNSHKIPEFTVILMATNIGKTDVDNYCKKSHLRGRPQTVTFQSGQYGRLMAGRFTENFFKSENNSAHSILGSPDYPLWAVVNVEIDNDNLQGTEYTCDINAIIAGLTDGTMYGDYTINFRGGTVDYIVGSNQGNPINNGSKPYKPEGSEKAGNYGQWPNASFFGRSVINVEQKRDDDPNIKAVTIGNLYAGGLGRKLQSDASKKPPVAVDMYLYGRTEVNVKSGTISGSVYGGGVGGVIGLNPWDAHVPYVTETEVTDADSAIINKVQYGDTRRGLWSQKTTSSPMPKIKLHNLNAAGNGYDIENLDLTKSSTTIKVEGGIINNDVYGGGYGYVPEMRVDAAIQGIGSVFGSTTLNISGGHIFGSVYGGSEGAPDYYGQQNTYGQTINHIAEMNGTVNINITGTADQYPTIGGNIYGGGKGIATSDDGTQEYLRIATAGNIELGTDYTTDIHILIDLPDDHPFAGNIYGGGQMGLVEGSTEVVIKGGLFKEPAGNPVAVFGGGKGEPGHQKKAKVTGNTHVIMDNSWGDSPSKSKQQDVYGNIYGGGEISTVEGNTKVHIRTGSVEGDVFGAGKGVASQPDAAAVTGKTEVIIGEEE